MADHAIGAVRGFLLAIVVYVTASVAVIPANDVARITIGVLASGILWSLWKTRKDMPEPAPVAKVAE